MSTIYKILQESFQGIKIVKAFATERVERRRFFGETKNLYRKSVRVAMIDAMSRPGPRDADADDGGRSLCWRAPTSC